MSEIILDANEKTPVRYSSRTEMVIIAIALVGTFFKIQHWPGANIMIAVGLTSLAIIYFPMGFYFLGNNKQNVVATVSGLFLSLIPVSIMFKTFALARSFSNGDSCSVNSAIGFCRPAIHAQKSNT